MDREFDGKEGVVVYMLIFFKWVGEKLKLKNLMLFVFCF